jgi:hypothetical protein
MWQSRHVPAARQSSRPWIGPVIGVVLVLTAVGGLVARSVYQPVASASTPPAGAPPTATKVPASNTPGSKTVQLSVDAAQSPYGKDVLDLLQAYYNAINLHSYVAWESTVTAAFIAGFNQQTWVNDYSTSQDSGMYVYRINAAPGNQLRVLITFTSHQSRDKAPLTAQFTCINWQAILSVVNTKLGWKVDGGNVPGGAAGARPIATECASS